MSRKKRKALPKYPKPTDEQIAQAVRETELELSILKALEKKRKQQTLTLKSACPLCPFLPDKVAVAQI